jgi:hypothetical protein
MVSPDALLIVLDEDAMRPAAAGLEPAIALERGTDAGSFGHVAGRVPDVIVPTRAQGRDGSAGRHGGELGLFRAVRYVDTLLARA